jgi:enhancing lycopene biosynthesis protein 2
MLNHFKIISLKVENHAIATSDPIKSLINLISNNHNMKHINQINLSNYKFEIQEFIKKCISVKKPIAALCVSPVVLALALQNSDVHPTMTLGTDQEKSPYDIHGFSSGLSQTGVHAEMKTIREISIDENLKIVSAPCYMMDATVLEIRNNIQQAIQALIQLI